MKYMLFRLAGMPCLLLVLLTGTPLRAQREGWRTYGDTIRKYIYRDYRGMLRPAGKALACPFITPGSSQYADVLWDWDSWLSNIALRQVVYDRGDTSVAAAMTAYERGCVLNFLSVNSPSGWIPIYIKRNATAQDLEQPAQVYAENMHKPCLAQHAAFLVRAAGGDATWLRASFYSLQRFTDNYYYHHRHKLTGLYYWQTDNAIGVDNDPATFGRPPRSSASIFLNCMMYKELLAMEYLCNRLDMKDVGMVYGKRAAALKAAVREHCWDERDGFYYSVDLNLRPVEEGPAYVTHSGMPRDWDCLIQRLGVWSGFMAMWAGIATPEQAARMVKEHYLNDKTFHAPFGVRTLSKMEKMYTVKASRNPSCWLGPVWGISNFMVWRGLVQYGYQAEAGELADNTITLFGKDFERFGALHEYYQPENGEPLLNKGFQNWNYLVLNMLDWKEGKHVITEF